MFKYHMTSHRREPAGGQWPNVRLQHMERRGTDDNLKIERMTVRTQNYLAKVINA